MCVIDAFRSESADARMQAFFSLPYIAGYRICMIAAGRGRAVFSAIFGQEFTTDCLSLTTPGGNTYLCMAE